MVNAGLSCGTCDACTSGEESECVNFAMLGEHLWGGAAEIAVVPANNVIKIPEHVSFTAVASSALTGLTAFRMITTKARLKSKDLVLIIGASGGVGNMLLKLCKYYGNSVISLTSNEEKKEKLKTMGVDHVINYHESDD